MIEELIITPAIQTLQVLNITGNVSTIPPSGLPELTLENAFGSLTSLAILLVLTISMTFRQSSEFIQKWYKGEVAAFERKYIAYAVVGFISSLPLAMGVFGPAAQVFLLWFGEWGFAGGLAMVAVYGYGWQHGTNKAASLIGHFVTKKPEQGESQPPTTTPSSQPPS